MGNSKWLLVVGILSLLAASVGGYYAYNFYGSLITEATVTTVNVPVQPYTMIRADMLEERKVPRGILEEPIYTTSTELVGKIATMTLSPGQLVYRHQVVQPQNFRYSDNPALEVVSFPVEPAKAVGGQVKIGHLITVYRVQKIDTEKMVRDFQIAAANSETSMAFPMETGKGAEAEILADRIRVVDVRSRDGDYANISGATSNIEETARVTGTRPLQIITVAVSHEIAMQLVELSVEDQADYEIWVTLSPLVEGAD